MKTITFDEARELLGGYSAVRIDGLHYVLRTAKDADVITLSLVTDENPMRVIFLRDDQPVIHLVCNVLRMREQAGEDAEVEIFRPWRGESANLFATAETAAALMDAMHSEVCKQSEGSDSAYAELYEAATRDGLGFTGIWQWIAGLTVASHAKMEALWESGEVEYIESVQVAAQLLHNYVTDPQTLDLDDIDPEKYAELWADSVKTLAESDQAATAWSEAQLAQRMLDELHEAARNEAGYIVGCFRRTNSHEIRYENYGGPEVIIRCLGSGLWRYDRDDNTDSDRPVQAFQKATQKTRD